MRLVLARPDSWPRKPASGTGSCRGSFLSVAKQSSIWHHWLVDRIDTKGSQQFKAKSHQAGIWLIHCRGSPISLREVAHQYRRWFASQIKKRTSDYHEPYAARHSLSRISRTLYLCNRISEGFKRFHFSASGYSEHLSMHALR